MSKTKKVILSILVIGVLVAVGVWYYVFVYKAKPRDMSKPGIEVTAVQLVNDFKKDEAAAYKKYTDEKNSEKLVQVTGEVASTGISPDSAITVSLKSDDLMTDVFCTLRKEEKTAPAVGSSCTIKGICTGMLSSVTIDMGAIIKK